MDDLEQHVQLWEAKWEAEVPECYAAAIEQLSNWAALRSVINFDHSNIPSDSDYNFNQGKGHCRWDNYGGPGQATRMHIAIIPNTVTIEFVIFRVL